MNHVIKIWKSISNSPCAHFTTVNTDINLILWRLYTSSSISSALRFTKHPFSHWSCLCVNFTTDLQSLSYGSFASTISWMRGNELTVSTPNNFSSTLILCFWETKAKFNFDLVLRKFVGFCVAVQNFKKICLTVSSLKRGTNVHLCLPNYNSEPKWHFYRIRIVKKRLPEILRRC